MEEICGNPRNAAIFEESRTQGHIFEKQQQQKSLSDRKTVENRNSVHTLISKC